MLFFRKQNWLVVLFLVFDLVVVRNVVWRVHYHDRVQHADAKDRCDCCKHYKSKTSEVYVLVKLFGNRKGLGKFQLERIKHKT